MGGLPPTIPYRQLEGLARGLGELISIPSPPRTTAPYLVLSLRLPNLNLEARLEKDLGYEPQEGEEVVIAVDATGIKVTNRREWRRRKRKGYVKIHVAVDTKTKKVISLEVSDERTDDGKKLKPLVRKARRRVKVKEASLPCLRG